jgi:hypothetical protein
MGKGLLKIFIQSNGWISALNVGLALGHYLTGLKKLKIALIHL